MLKGPLVRESKCVWEFGDVFFQVDPAIGGRVTSARIGATELLVTPAMHAMNYGSTFWTSPQSDWSWPPLAEIDTAPYVPMAVDAEAACTMTGSKVNAAARANVHEVSVSKKFSADFARQALVVEYTIHNQGTAMKRLAPWEITRVAPDGLTFYGADTPPFVPAMLAPVPPTLPVTNAEGCFWFKYDASVTHNAKLYGDGKGWIAHVTPQNLLLVKTFTDVQPAQFAPREAEIEIYASNNATGRYVEVENQGAHADVAPGQTLSWTVRWYLRALPANVMATAGNPALVQFVQQTIQ